MKLMHLDEVAPSTEFVMDKLQIIALVFMLVVYVLKIRWLLKFGASSERTPARGDKDKAIRYSLMTIAMPWELPSTRTHWIRYAEFVIFHIAVAVSIAVTLVMPYAPEAVGSAGVVRALQILFGLGALMGLSRLFRRIGVSAMRAISSPDDYFSLVMLTVWFIAGIAAVPQNSETALLAFFGLTAFFLVYVPFSKISHYIYWPFSRYYIGKHLGHRGVYPTKSVPREV